MPVIKYLIEDKDILKKCYLIAVEAYPCEANMLKIYKILKDGNAEMIGIMGNGSAGADQFIYVVCEHLNTSKHVYNIISLEKIDCDYPAEAFLPEILLDEIRKTGVAELYPADMKIALLDYYLNPQKESVKRYKSKPRTKYTFPKVSTSEIEYHKPSLKERISAKIIEFYRGYFF